ncbi:MAG: LppX_LprAFG lipoprotein [Dehalococcoidia bacterium]
MSARGRLAAALRAVVFAALAVGVAACGGGEGGDEVDVAAVDAPALLEAAAARIEQARSFRFRLDHENGGTVILDAIQMQSAEGEVAGPDEMSLQIKALAGPLNVALGIVVLPDQAWVTNPLTGRWERQDIDVSAFFDPANGVTALMRGVREARVAGTETVDGVAMYVVEATVDSGDLSLFAQGAPAGQPLGAKAWIGVDDPLVYRIEVTGAITAAEPANLVRRLTLRDWGAEIAISPPR